MAGHHPSAHDRHSDHHRHRQFRAQSRVGAGQASGEGVDHLRRIVLAQLAVALFTDAAHEQQAHGQRLVRLQRLGEQRDHALAERVVRGVEDRDRRCPEVDQLVVQLLFGTEVLDDQRRADACVFGDVLERDFAVRPSRECFPGRRDDLRTRLLGRTTHLLTLLRAAHQAFRDNSRRPDNARPSVNSSANSRSPPIGRPEANRDTVSPGMSRIMRTR